MLLNENRIVGLKQNIFAKLRTNIAQIFSIKSILITSFLDQNLFLNAYKPSLIQKLARYRKLSSRTHLQSFNVFYLFLYLRCVNIILIVLVLIEHNLEIHKTCNYLDYVD